MRYILEISQENGDGLGDQPYSLLESETPLPIPNVGDRINLQGTATMAKVASRQMDVYGTDEITIKFQVFCQNASTNG